MSDFIYENIAKLCASLVAGAIIGAEREYKSKNAGFRTMILVTLGSTLFTIVSEIVAKGKDFHVVGNIVVGIGFLGAGAIYKEGTSPRGLTTAVTIWVSAAIGMAIGEGQYEFAVVVITFVMIVLLGFPYLQKFIDMYNSERIYKVTVYCNTLNIKELARIFTACKLRGKAISQVKKHDMVTLTFAVSGSTEGHVLLIQNLHENKHIIEFEA